VTAEVDDRRRLFEVVVVADAMLVKYYEPAWLPSTVFASILCFQTSHAWFIQIRLIVLR
jgi:hypothetical protein